MTTQAPLQASSLAEAILAVQSNLPPLIAEQTGQVQTREYKYIDLHSIMEKIQPLLSEHRLTWVTEPNDIDGRFVLHYELTHVPSGEAQVGNAPLLVPAGATSQALGSAISYMRRYVLCAILNLTAVEKEDDGAAAEPKLPSVAEVESEEALNTRLIALQSELRQHPKEWAAFAAWWQERAKDQGWRAVQDAPVEVRRGIVTKMAALIVEGINGSPPIDSSPTEAPA